MARFFRFSLVLISLVQLFFAVAFYLQWPIATGIWPFPGTTPLTFILTSSFFAAAAASTLWTVLSGSDGALAGIGLDYLMIFAPLAVIAIGGGVEAGDARMIGFGAAAAGGVAVGIALLAGTLRTPLDRSVPVPGPVKWSFVLFIIALLAVSTQLIRGVPNIIPWTLTPQLSAVIGWMFLGAATYFAYGLWKPAWANAAGQLLGFLAYDLVLIWPFLSRLPTVAPEFRSGQIVYLVVVIYSGLLAVYYLFIHRPTRLWGRTPAAVRAAA